MFFKQHPYDNGLSVKEIVEEYDGFFTYLRIYKILEELNEIKKTNNDLLNYLFNNEDTRLIKEIAEDVMYSFGITKFRDPKRYDKHNLPLPINCEQIASDQIEEHNDRSRERRDNPNYNTFSFQYGEPNWVNIEKNLGIQDKLEKIENNINKYEECNELAEELLKLKDGVLPGENNTI